MLSCRLRSGAVRVPLQSSGFNLLAIEHSENLSIQQDKVREKCRLVELGLLLVVYRGDKGGYPKSLDDLSDVGGGRIVICLRMRSRCVLCWRNRLSIPWGRISGMMAGYMRHRRPA